MRSATTPKCWGTARLVVEQAGKESYCMRRLPLPHQLAVRLGRMHRGAGLCSCPLRAASCPAPAAARHGTARHGPRPTCGRSSSATTQGEEATANSCSLPAPTSTPSSVMRFSTGAFSHAGSAYMPWTTNSCCFWVGWMGWRGGGGAGAYGAHTTSKAGGVQGLPGCEMARHAAIGLGRKCTKMHVLPGRLGAR